MRFLLGCVFLLCLTLAANAASVVFLGGGNDSELFREAFVDLELPETVTFESYCVPIDSPERIRARARQADILIISGLVQELRVLAANEIDFTRTKLYAIASNRLPEGIPALEPKEFQAYRANRRPENFRNMVRWVVNRELDSSVTFDFPLTLPELGVTHPAAGEIFSSIAEFQTWAKSSGHARSGGTVAFAVHSGSINDGDLTLFRHLTDEFERQNLTVAVVYGDEVRLIRELLLDANGRPTVNAVLALSFKFKSGLGEELRCALADLGLPVFNALRLYRQTTPEWEDSVRGMNDFSVAFGFIAPEISGLIEPSLLFGTRVVDRIQEPEPFPETIRITAQRLKKWIGLQRKPNAEKRIAIFLYNGSGGKQNIGASYLNVPRSLVNITQALADAGYSVGGVEQSDEAELTGLLLQSARNVGSWAPGELADLAAQPEVLRLSRADYARYFSTLPEALRNAVIAEWGPPENAEIMTWHGDFLIPMLRRGNLVILPEPMRGWGDDPHKLLHSATLPPHHQYLAVYLWLRHEFRADAMIHLGRHGSSEWLPGKQLGLSAACAPLVVRGDIPEIYPYISDGIGEGIVAKRRASAVMIDHLTPFLKIPEQEAAIVGLRQHLSDLRTADPALRPQRETALLHYAEEQKYPERLGLTLLDPGFLDALEEYAEHRESLAPFGLHSFGASPSEEEIETMASMIPAPDRAAAREHLRSAGQDEKNALLRALNGRFIEPGPSGDPIRNPASLPVGRNFYSFDPAKIPTVEALEKGRALADELLASERKKNGKLPRKVAIVLWAGETTRTDGVNEAMALALMGMRVKYDKNKRAAGILPIPGAQLNRPRVDVLITTSGAYRDQFGDLIRLLDLAQRQAARLTDTENFIRSNTEEAAAKLKREGASDAEAAEWSSRRVFFPAPGTYGTRVNKLAGSSGLWEKEEELAGIYTRNMAYSIDAAGEIGAVPAALSAGLRQVEALFHSRSSNVYGVTDIDDMYQYLGGLSLAVRQNSGNAPGEYIIDQRNPVASRVTPLKTYLSAELDSRLFHPEWIRSMMAENYSGGKTFARTADNLWGWQAVTPDNVAPAEWQTLHSIYVEDRYDLGMEKFFSDGNEWAFQSMTGRMLEAVRKEYWKAPLATRQSLASAYAQSVIRQGMACCDHTCNNPLLNQMVVNLISMPGVLSAEQVMKFKVAVERAAAKNLDEQVRERRELQKALIDSFGLQEGTPRPPSESSSAEARTEQRESAPSPGSEQVVKGFRMQPDRANATQTELSSSGLKWTILLAVIGVIAVFGLGCFRSRD